MLLILLYKLYYTLENITTTVTHVDTTGRAVLFFMVVSVLSSRILISCFGVGLVL